MQIGAGAFIIAFCLSWVNVAHRPHVRWALLFLTTGAVMFLVYQIFKYVYIQIVRRRNLHSFWQNEFSSCLDELFFIGSLVFVLVFFRYKIDAMLFGLLILCLFFTRLHQYFARHALANFWQKINLSVFLLSGFVFLFANATQIFAREYFIFDNAIRPAFVSLRAFSITMFWLFGFSVAGLIFFYLKKWRRYLALSLWSIIFVAGMFLSASNLEVLYFSGLYFSPTAWQHAGGGMGVAWNWLTLVLVVGFVLALVIFIILINHFVRALKFAPKRYWRFYLLIILATSIFSLAATSALKTTPEFVIVKSFYDYYFRARVEVALSPMIFEKLRKFGLNYDPSDFYLAHREHAFDATPKLLSEKFQTQKPNIVIFFLESFSARLTDVYNSGFKDLTPGLDAMAKNKNTTVFRKYYNASTPTITGIMSILCSFLPPTGHQEIEIENKLQRLGLLCLPEVLKRNGFAYTGYITAVDKDFANKSTLLPSMGVKEIYGTEELKKYITGEPLAWGYSDHQMLPALWNMMQTQQQPFLYMLSTVDTHPPFNMAKDRVRYTPYNSDALDMFHTTDDAFGKFWAEFQNSAFASNTIVIAVADHAVFPAMYSSVKVPGYPGWLDFYDENTFMMYIPDSVLPKEVSMYSSSLDFTPTLLNVLNIDTKNSFEGYSLFDPAGRVKYPNILGMHEFGLYINQAGVKGKRVESYNLPDRIQCGNQEASATSSTPLTLCEYLDFYHWKRQMFEQGRFWEKGDVPTQ